ncbi:hypothetical protein [Luteolibacter sp. Populi]|uniref:hypothetical protein n=1 Tax=Luteolibacter sp. Populi TaxID=3230487 RepID=UPI0034654720
MKRVLLSLLGALALAHGQGTPQPQPEVLRGVGTSLNLRWHGVAGRSYFIQVTDDLKSWHFAPLIEAGNDEDIEHEIGSLKGREFLRLVYTDQTAVDLDTADFDGDGLGNLAEITVHFTNPLKIDSDHDGLDDGWEIDNDLDPNDDGSINPDNGGSGDPDCDGSTNLDEKAGKTKPKVDQDFPLQLNYIIRNASGQTMTDDDVNTSITLNDWTGDSSTLESEVVLSPILLSSKAATMPFPGTIPRAASGLVVTNLEHGSVRSLMNFSGTTVDGKIFASGYTSEAKAWVRGPATPNPRTIRMLRVTEDTSISLTPPVIEDRAYSDVKVVTLTIPANAEESDGFELASATTYISGVRQRQFITLSEVKIKPVEGMVGVLGDMVPSNQTTDPELHFVTPKESAEIAEDYVTLEATGLFPDEIAPGTPKQIVAWEGGEEFPNDPLKRRVKRDQTWKNTVKIITRPRGEEEAEDLAKLNVWVVWSTAEIVSPYQNVSFTFVGSPGPLDFPGATYGGLALQPNSYWRFKFTIQPAEIVSLNTAADRPDFSGENITPVPGEGKMHFFNTDEPADHAQLKWDLTRMIQVKILNPQDIPKGNFPNLYTFRNQPQKVDIAVPFPLNPVEGNDDPSKPGPQDEDGNPYAASQALGTAHDAGAITSVDGPVFGFQSSIGVPGAFLAQIADFREFARLEIHSGKRSVENPSWFRISDYILWHHAIAAIYGTNPAGNRIWADAGSHFGEGVFVIPGN